MGLIDSFEERRRERPSAVALGLAAQPAGGGSREISYGRLFAAVDALAVRLAAELGDGRTASGERIAVVAGNRPETVVAILAALRSGAVVVPVNVAYTAAEIGHRLADSTPRRVVAEPAYRSAVETAIAGLDGGARPEVVDLEELTGLAAGTGSEPAAPLPRRPGPDDPALLVYTSGTTGRSKGAVLTHGNLAATVDGLRDAWAWRPDDRLLLTLPLFHVHGLVVGLFTALASGARVELRRRFRASEVAGELAAGAATLFFGVPTMYVRLVEELERLDGLGAIPSMRLFASGSAPLAPETFRAFERLTGSRIVERYGMSETGMNLSNPYRAERGERRPGTVGLPLPGVEIRIVDRADPSGADLPEGEPGELLVHGPNVFAGYHRDPAKTAASFVPGDGGRRWFRTGDLARRDPATGHVTLLGRSRELILRGGLNVYPREVEEVLESAPGVREAAVVGRADAEWGEVPVAYVVPSGGAEPDGEALLARCRERLAGFKVPGEVRFVGELPRNALGKVQKHRLG